MSRKGRVLHLPPFNPLGMCEPDGGVCEPQTLVKKSWRRIWSIEGRSWGEARRMAARSCRAGSERLAGSV